MNNIGLTVILLMFALFCGIGGYRWNNEELIYSAVFFAIGSPLLMYMNHLIAKKNDEMR